MDIYLSKVNFFADHCFVVHVIAVGRPSTHSEENATDCVEAEPQQKKQRLMLQNVSACCQTDPPMLVDAAVQCDFGNRTVNVGSSESGKPVINTEQNTSSPDYSFCSSQLTDSQTSDNTYHPSTSQCSSSDTDDAENSLLEDRKFIVYESHLDKLFSICSICTHTSRVTKHVIGSFIAITQFCAVCGINKYWTSQPMIGNLPAGNLHLSAAIYFSGGSFSKAERVMSALNVEGLSSATFYRHCESFLQPTVLSFWRTHQLELIKQIGW